LAQTDTKLRVGLRLHGDISGAVRGQRTNI